MSDATNGWRFERGLDDDFMLALKSLADGPKNVWFAEVLRDHDLIFGIRNNYMNVYWRGQSLFKIEPVKEKKTIVGVKVSTHPKYLLDPNLQKAVVFTGQTFEIGGH